LPDYVMPDYRMTVRLRIFLRVTEAYAIGSPERTFSVFLVFWPSGRIPGNRYAVNATAPNFGGVVSLFSGAQHLPLISIFRIWKDLKSFREKIRRMVSRGP